MHVAIRKGFDIPISGVPESQIDSAAAPARVALLGGDYPGLAPKMEVKEGDHVRLGDPLFRDKHAPQVAFVSPGCGVVENIQRGPRRTLQAVTVRIDGDDAKPVDSAGPEELARMTAAKLRDRLLESGVWPALRARPYNCVADPATSPDAIFVTAIDTNPLAPPPATVIAAEPESFSAGLRLLARLTAGPVYTCTARDSGIAVPDEPQYRHVEFSGPHPAGLVGTHIHFLHPVGAGRMVWHIGYQDVIAWAKTLSEGRLATDRIISLAGPRVLRPRLLRTRIGASTADLVQGELAAGDSRVISGSVLHGHRASGWARFLGRYHLQITALPEGRPRELLGWLAPGRERVSALNVFLAAFSRKRRFPLDTAQNGSPRAMVPIGSYERVMPLDILPGPLLKALVVGDRDAARDLGCLELSEEDVALLSYVDCGKYDFGPILRETLLALEGES